MPFIENEPVDTILIEKILCVEEGEGREEGLEHGILAGKIQTLQQMLNQPPASTQELLMESLEALGRKVDTLCRNCMKHKEEA